MSVPRFDPTLPLAGMRVLELGHIVAGPSGGLILAELGADVCKVEDPRTGDTARNQANAGTTFFAFNRDKRSIALDLRTDAGREIFGRLVRQSDVTGLPGRPMRAAASIIDIGGATYGVIGILAALYQREATGQGANIRSGLFETAVFWMNQHLARVQLTGESPGPRDPDDISGIGRSMGWGL
jgi:crotonobetainyl-CoA:carnitine CoA-transferase CaiB-like acyl-CoA transferase